MEIIYNWTSDGTPEKCEVIHIEHTDETCYHCGQPINNVAAKLIAPDKDEYILHKECAYDGCARAADCLALDEIFSD